MNNHAHTLRARLTIEDKPIALDLWNLGTNIGVRIESSNGKLLAVAFSPSELAELLDEAVVMLRRSRE